MKKSKPKNKFDLLVESLIKAFSEIKNFEIINESENTKQIWNYLVQTVVEINSIKNLFVGIYIPQTNKFIYEWKKEFSESLYASLLKIDDSMWKNEVHKLTRIAYVTLFHRYETFAGSVFKIIESNYIEFDDKSVSLEQYAKNQFDFKVDKEWYINDFIKKINWVCNSEKHNDGFPSVNHSFYKADAYQRILYPESKQIEISSDSLKLDIETMIEVVRMIFQNIMSIALYRLAEESMGDFDDAEFNKEQQERLDLMKFKIQQIIEITKRI